MANTIPPEDLKALKYMRKVVGQLHSVDDLRYLALEDIGVDIDDPLVMKNSMNPENIYYMWQGGVFQKYNDLFNLSDNEMNHINNYFKEHGETYEFVHHMEKEFGGLVKKSDSRWLKTDVNPGRLGLGLCPL